MSFGQYLAKKRVDSGFISQRSLAVSSGMSNATIARLENDAQHPTPHTLKVLSRHLDVDYEELMQEAGYLDSTRKLNA